MTMLTFVWSPPLEEVLANWQKVANGGITRALYMAGEEAASVLTEAVRDAAPVRTGESAAGIHGVSSPNGDGILIEIMGPAVFNYVVGGTAPHEIVAHGRALAWLGGDGVTHFAKSVMHPGTQPNDFPSAAWQNVGGDIISLVQTQVMAAINSELNG